MMAGREGLAVQVSHMARRGFVILFTFLGMALFVSIVGFAAMYVLFEALSFQPRRFR